AVILIPQVREKDLIHEVLSAHRPEGVLWEINAPSGRDPKPRDDKILRPSRVQITRRSLKIPILNARSTWALFERRTFRVSLQNPESPALDRVRFRPALPVRLFLRKHERTPDYLFAEMWGGARLHQTQCALVRG